VTLQTQEYGAVTVVKPDKPLTGGDADEFKARLLEIVKKTLGRVVLDLSAVSYVDSKGLESLIDVTQELSQSGRALKLCTANETLRQVLMLTGLSSQFEYFEDANSAVRSFL
jgi:anti-sigma B factor antagonist